jgi:hypothetical protein
MKNFVTIFLVLSFLSASQNIYSQDTNIVKYLPLKVGNVWVYHGNSVSTYCNPHYSHWYDRYKLTATTLINGKIYFVFNHTQITFDGNCITSSMLFQSDLPIRVDSLTLNIYKSTNCGVSTEMLIDSLKSDLFDSSRSCDYVLICTDTSMYNIFGSNILSKSFSTAGWDCGFTQRYVKNIGLVFYQYACATAYQYNITLSGCVINGVLYGDTNMIVGVNQISSEIPKTFSLYQNYPNPFNPGTKIKFSLPNPSEGGAMKTKLTIYDALGREVATLVNQSLAPGSYEVEWDASNYPSGVYYYQLTINSEQLTKFVQTKKLVLMK